MYIIDFWDVFDPRLTQKELIDFCNSHIQGGGGCPCKFEYKCGKFEKKYGACPYLENTYHDGEYYTDEEI